MRKRLTAILTAALLCLSLAACQNGAETEQETPGAGETVSSQESGTAAVPVETDEEQTEEQTGLPTVSSTEAVTEPPTVPPTEAVIEPPTAAPSTPAASSGNGILADTGKYPDWESYSNKSVPYGNDWDDKDQTGLPQGVHYYEALYGKTNPVYRIKTDQKLLYLTMDEGYEAGYTPKILDILKAKNVKAVFFITKQFFDSNPELVERMINEGHVVGNHTCLHPSGGFPRYADEHGFESFTSDVERLHKLVYDRFGYTMRLFRFPEGEFSEKMLAWLRNHGYNSVFWSYAHYDYNREKQPEVSVTLERCLSHMAPGAVYLLHAVSSSNTEALADFIDGARAAGYEFGAFPVDEVVNQ